MWQTVKTKAVAFHRSFHNSETILFARLQVLIGAVWAVLSVTDLGPVINNPKYLTAWLIFSGVITELSRRSRSEQDCRGSFVPRRDDSVNVTVNVPSASAAPDPASPLGPTSGNTK